MSENASAGPGRPSSGNAPASGLVDRRRVLAVGTAGAAGAMLAACAGPSAPAAPAAPADPSGPERSQDPSRPSTATSAVPPRFIPTPVGRLAVWDLPSRAPSASPQATGVLWPSVLADHRIYRRQIPVWQTTHRLLVIDGPGHGASGPPPASFTMADCATAVAVILDACGVREPVIPIGTSWGGLVGAEFALAYPARTRALVMLNTPLFVDPDGPSWSDRFVVWGARWLHATSLYSDGVARSFFLPSTRAARLPELDDFRDHLHRADGTALATAVRAVLLEREPLAPRLGGIDVPALFIAGLHDAMYPPEPLRAAVDRMPRGRFVSLATSHISAIDAPDEVARRVAEFTRAA